VDTGSVDAEWLASSDQRGIALVGPTMPDRRWQATAGKSFDLAYVSIDWSTQPATYPQGQTSSRVSRTGERMEGGCAAETCAACPACQDCPRSHTTGRVLHLRPQADHDAFQARRTREQTPECRQQSALRAGMEATLSQAVRGMGIRRSCSDGLARTPVQHVVTAVAITLMCIDAVLSHHPRGTPRCSQFAQLASAPARIGASSLCDPPCSSSTEPFR
jgi:transposase